MTSAVQWLDEKLQDKMFVEYGYINGIRKVVIPLEDYMKFKKEALEMEKKQIIDAHLDGQSLVSCKDEYAEQYYQETFGSKGTDAKDVVLGYKTSLDAQMLDSQLPQTTSDKWKEYQDWLNEPPEISDEEITKLANEHVLYNDSKRQWVIEGMKLYREQLKQRQ